MTAHRMGESQDIDFTVPEPMSEGQALAILRLWWADEGCTWKADHTGYGRDKGEWCVALDWTTDSTYALDADWVSYTWQFYGTTIAEALSDAATWVARLAPWKPCPECDGKGEWNGEPCDSCATIGLAAQPTPALIGSSTGAEQ